jgi:ATP-dependent protease HslVU (ClpYQ) ATPase subunit
MKNIEQLNDLFNLDPAAEKPMELTTIPEAMNSNKEMDQEDDYQLARQTMRKLLMKGETTLDELIELSKNSEHPRTYEVAGQFMKTMSDVSKDLLNLQKQVKDLKAEEAQQKIGTQNNVVFAGSTAELFKALKQNKDNGNIIEQ